MASKQQQSGMRGVYLAAAELSGRGFIVSPTSRSALGADLLVTDASCQKAFSVQVKTSGRPAAFWLLSGKARGLTSRSHIYIFVQLKPEGEAPEYYVVPSRVVSTRMETQRRGDYSWYSFPKAVARRYQDRWGILRKPR